jgi:hypothetical protein
VKPGELAAHFKANRKSLTLVHQVYCPHCMKEPPLIAALVLRHLPHVRRRLDKLNSSGFEERHLYVVADWSAMPAAVSLALVTPGVVPREALRLPRGLTMLWLLMYSRQVLVATEDASVSHPRPTPCDGDVAGLARAPA